jgi:hypothetical protein
VYWGLDGTAVDLNALIDPASGWIRNQATAIADTGWIGGVGFFDPDGPGPLESYQSLYSIQIQLPEPSAVMLLAVGFFPILARRRMSSARGFR